MMVQILINMKSLEALSIYQYLNDSSKPIHKHITIELHCVKGEVERASTMFMVIHHIHLWMGNNNGGMLVAEYWNIRNSHDIIAFVVIPYTLTRIDKESGLIFENYDP